MESIAEDRGAPESVALPAQRAIEQVRDHAIFLLDRHGRAASWNEGVREILGWSEDGWLGQPAKVGFTPEDAAAGLPEKELRQASETGRAQGDRWMQRSNGERFFAVGAVSRLTDGAGQPIGFLRVLRDFTAHWQTGEDNQLLLASERAARAEAERQSAALTAAIEAMPDAVYIGTAEGITRCNAQGLAMLGAGSLHELQKRVDELGRRFRVRREREGPLVEPQDLPFARALRGESAVLETWATNVSTGEDVFIRGAAAPIRVDGRIVGAVAVNSDLTYRVQLQQNRRELSHVRTVLHERDEQLRALVEGVRDYAIFTIDPSGRIASWHEGAQLMKGYSAEEAIGMPFDRLFPAAERAAGRPQQELEVAARSGEYKGEGVRLRKDGSTFEAAAVLTALHGAQGELLGYLKLTQDISARKAHEREREEMLRNAQAARSNAERASHSKDEFLATISHELRTPLSAILGWANVLERGGIDADGLRKGLTAISRNARVQVQLIEDLLDMNRIESGQLRLELQAVEPGRGVTAAIESILPAATAKGVGLRTVLEAAAGPVSGDPGRLQQIVWNLLSNAVKFTPAGGHVTVSVARAGAEVEVSVADTGQGIEPEFLTRVFDRFQQQDATTTRRHGGLGLGLAIVRQLAQLHGGSVRVQSPGSGQGATFTVRLPALAGPRPGVPDASTGPDAAGAVAERAPGESAVPGAHRLDGVSVLLIDDERDVRAMAAHVLRAAGAQVFAAGSAKEGFELFLQHRPQTILTDIGMPVHDGYDFLHWVRSLEACDGGQTPAAAFTAYARPEDRRRAMAVGYQAHLVKPVEPAQLVAAVAALAEGAGRDAGLRGQR
jgi:PAS domain S-box-containing protein